MRPFKLKAAVLASVFLAGGPLLADETVRPQNCTWCHGTSAQGFWISPRLAGQRQQYLEKELLSFSQHTRDNPPSKQYMWGAVAALSPQAAHELAIYFSALPPQAADDGDRELVTVGKTLYEEGNADLNIVSCLVCHGPNGEGVGEIPRLAGLGYSYLKKRLAQWNEGYHAAAQPMPLIASKLATNQVEALASYLSFVK
jgi:cytochrome c553